MVTRVDLELEMSGPSGPSDSLVWIEIKHRAELSGNDQLEKYDAALKEMPHARKRLVFLPPAGYEWGEKENRRPEGLCESSWQHVGETLREWREAANGKPLHELWIVGQFLEYLEEEGLFMSEPLSGEQVRQLRRAEETKARFSALVEDARRQIDGWVDGKARDPAFPQSVSDPEVWPKRGLRWPEFWRTYGRTHGLLEGAVWFEWNFRVPDDRSIGEELGAPDEALLGAGLTLEHSIESDHPQLAALPEHRLRLAREEGGFDRLFRYGTLADLVDGKGSLSEQAGAVAHFVQLAFEDALAVLRPGAGAG